MGSDKNNPANESGSSSSDDLSEYMQVFLDESAEELDSLVEAILLLEDDPRNADALNKAFRMLHSLKGSCGMMGFEVVGLKPLIQIYVIYIHVILDLQW